MFATGCCSNLAMNLFTVLACLASLDAGCLKDSVASVGLRKLPWFLSWRAVEERRFCRLSRALLGVTPAEWRQELTPRRWMWPR